ncbi:unnamed protein product [Calicophoron daubneyi]|uniref:Glutathione S-transferase C-terminal domain-containing protein n=1 Tax=Calicophoron daubneyi TaxID=300641 RepID=A0AAV2TN68_CALDB
MAVGHKAHLSFQGSGRGLPRQRISRLRNAVYSHPVLQLWQGDLGLLPATDSQTHVVGVGRCDMTADDVEFLASVTEKLKARDVDEQALTYQFLEWKAQKLNDNPDVKQLLARLKEVDTHLVSSTFLCGERLTAVDILLTKTLGQFLCNLSFQEKESIGNVLRWYNQVASESGSSPRVIFQRMALYS